MEPEAFGLRGRRAARRAAGRYCKDQRGAPGGQGGGVLLGARVEARSISHERWRCEELGSEHWEPHEQLGGPPCPE